MKKQKKLLFILSLFFFLLFIVFSLMVKKDILNQFDFFTTVRLQNYIPKKIDSFLSTFSLLGSFEITFLILILLLIMNKKILGIVVTFFNFGAAHLIEIFGKLFLEHPGPPFIFSRYDLPLSFPSFYIRTPSSYPSGHSLRTVFLAIILFFLILKSKKLNLKSKIILWFFNFTFVFLMLISRVSLGEHWPTDVIGGTLLGLAFAFFSLIFL